jgi:transposase-like protein
MMKKPRRQISAADKVAIVKAHLVDKVPVSDLCDKHQILPTQFYGWQKLFFENGTAAFDAASKRSPREDGKDRKIAQLEAKLAQKNEVVAELLQEHVQLKKEFGEL